MKFRYPLQTDNFNLWDRIKAAAFVLNKNNRLTCGPKVLELEQTWEHMFGHESSSCLATSSGSTANHLLVETFLQTNGLNPADVTVFCPSTTWSSSVTPWIMRGCNIEFVDINLYDFSFDYGKLEIQVAESRAKIKVIWPTALIGFVPDIKGLKKISKTYNCYLFADLCETTMGYYDGEHLTRHFDMCTTSFFWAHEICGIEMGMLFLNPNSDWDEAFQNAKMIRSHGLTRVLSFMDLGGVLRAEAEKENPDIDPNFLFARLGTNYRPTDLNAYFCLMDTARYRQHETHRRKIWNYFTAKIPSRYRCLNPDIVPFCLPFLHPFGGDHEPVSCTKERLNRFGWETRPIIAFLPQNPAFKQYAKREYPNSKFLNDHGFYVGLNSDLTTKDIDKLLEIC